MVPPASSSPAFGQADLSNCEREQIHLAGSIQPHGALLVVQEPGCVVVQASVNAAEFLGLSAAGLSSGSVLGRTLSELDRDLGQRVGARLTAKMPKTRPVAVRCHIGPRRRPFDVLLHRPQGGGVVIELERAGPPVDHARAVEDALQRILGSLSVRALCDEVARIFRELTGYDRVMVYRFDEAGHGEVFSEERRPELEAFLGNRYPASDIPKIARRLYVRNRVRVLVDIGYTPVPIVPAASPISGADLDMSLCTLRSISPIHVQYLKNMGVGATLVASLVVGGQLWGLVSCHHYVPRIIQFELRATCELLAEACATRIAALESFDRGQAELSVRRLEQRMVAAISREGDWRNALFDSAQSLLQPLRATGAALLFDGQTVSTGEVPGSMQLRQIGLWLDDQPRAPVIATSSLGIDRPQFLPLAAVASGMVATPLSSSPGEYLVWFRPERVRTVTWGGNPFKAVVTGDTPFDLSPRRSFAQWHQVVERTSEPWSAADLTAARLIGDTVKDVIVQFRSVGMLIAQDRMEQIRQQVRVSELPVIIADAHGRILLMNDALRGLPLPSTIMPQWLEELPALFAGGSDIAQRLLDLMERQIPWREEIALLGDRNSARPLLVRGDPVCSPPGRVLGFVLLFTDLTEHKAAEAARRRFQERILEENRRIAGRLNSKSDLVFQHLLSSVVENAQLAALEIADGVDTARMPELLDCVRTSVTRTTGVLEHLIWHARLAADED
jgi:light-regulated signal transduction histidine kinase (bacteriophytochrome)